MRPGHAKLLVLLVTLATTAFAGTVAVGQPVPDPFATLELPDPFAELAPVAEQTPATADSDLTVSADPVDWTPHVLDGEVRAITVMGDIAVVGGDFSAVESASGDRTYERWYLFAFSLRTGAVLDFEPYLDGPVFALAPGPGDTVFVGGAFGWVDDIKQRGITQLSLATGGRVRGFQTSLGSGDVRTLGVSGSWLYAGGTFRDIGGQERRGLARLRTSTGAVDSWNARVNAPELGNVRVESLALTAKGDRMVAVGSITEVGPEFRVQIAMWDTSAPVPVLADWWTNAYNVRCHKDFGSYVRGVDFAPDGSYLVVVSTGGMSRKDRLCDTAARFDTYRQGEVRPTWVNHTGGNTLYAVEITASAVYVGGHQKWMDNPHGNKSKGRGAVDRVGIAAVHPRTGKALSWNPTRKRGVGVRAFAFTSYGLLVGSDTDELGREYHGRIGLFPPLH